MKRLLFVSLLVLLMLFIVACSREEYPYDDSDKIVIYYFSGPGCPSCIVQDEFMRSIDDKYSDVEVVFFDVSVDDNDALLARLARAYEERIITPPATFVGPESIVGFNTAESTGLLIEDVIARCQRQPCLNPSVVLRNFEGR